MSKRTAKAYVYFIAPDTMAPDRVKIGFTRGHPKKRLAAMQTGSPEKLRLLAFVEAEQFLEGLLHEAFAPLRLHGEWFALGGKLLSLVGWLYHQRQGESAIWMDEFQRACNKVLTEEEPMRGAFCTWEEWHESFDVAGLSDWLAEEAWAAYQAEKAGRE